MQEVKKTRPRKTRKIVEPHFVCDCEDLLPFAWRTPPEVDLRRCSKVLRDMGQREQERLAPPKSKK
ncbi:MAG: hypothetical protein HFE35_00970 [Clostridia bacterium]|jgi:hypothetical protein|uniref:hypothetical protein n=1 Tax=Pumilibacter muris TaxID=2941510 RepID=UPI00203B9D59|nr:hypothetical protein [Pumilibacter muris]MCI8595377.1 hypothetical protein [Clostridia bacterium]